MTEVMSAESRRSALTLDSHTMQATSALRLAMLQSGDSLDGYQTTFATHNSCLSSLASGDECGGKHALHRADAVDLLVVGNALGAARLTWKWCAKAA